MLNIAVGVIRSKAIALILGPTGIGLAGLYGSIIDVTQSIVGLGINSSGVRQIAEAVASGDSSRIACTSTVLRRTSLVLGVAGAVLLATFSRQISKLTLGSALHAQAVALLGVAVLFRLVAAGQGALIQGMRRISDLARIGIAGSIFGTVLTVFLVYFWGHNGVAPSLLATAAVTSIASWWYSKKINLSPHRSQVSGIRDEAAALLKLGFAFMTSGFLMMGAGYVVRITVLHKVGFEATGLYQSAWTLGGLYVAFIMKAMGADFYPRLTAAANHHIECTRLVNEQSQVGLLIAGPGVLATITLAPLVITFLYSAKFVPAVPMLRWICLATLLQVITWPMGFIIIAQGRQKLFIFAELAWTAVYVALAWICIAKFGLNGAGIAFFGSYVFHLMLVYPIARYLTGFRWSATSKRIIQLFSLTVGAVFCGFYLLPTVAATIVGLLALILNAIYSVRMLLTLTASSSVPRSASSLFRALGWIRARSHKDEEREPDMCRDEAAFARSTQ